MESNKKDKKPAKKGAGKYGRKLNVQAKVGVRGTSLTQNQPLGYFICDKAHKTRDCPREEKQMSL